MKFFIVRFVIHDMDRRKLYLDPHVQYLEELVARGVLRASGPVIGTPEHMGVLIFAVPDRESLADALAGDPFIIHGLVNEITSMEWNPLFGIFAAESSHAS